MGTLISDFTSAFPTHPPNASLNPQAMASPKQAQGNHAVTKLCLLSSNHHHRIQQNYSSTPFPRTYPGCLLRKFVGIFSRLSSNRKP